MHEAQHSRMVNHVRRATRGLFCLLGAFQLAATLLLPVVAARSAAAAEPEIPILQDQKERLPKPELLAVPRIRFLTTTDFPPFNFLDASGRLTGLHIDLARAICAELGVAERCQIQALRWGDLETALAKGEGEAIIAGLAVTPETRSRHLFTRPYLTFPARFVMPKATAAQEPLAQALKDKPVGVVAGSAHERMLADYFSSLKPAPYPNQDKLLADLKEGRIGAAFGDGMRLGFWLAGEASGGCCRFAGGPYLAPEYLGPGLAVAVKRQDTVLAAAFDHALLEITVKGVFAELYLRYFPVGFF